VPNAIAVTSPDEDPTVATAGLALLHVPPVVVVVSVVVCPAQSRNTPLIPPGNGLIDTIAMVLQPVDVIV